MASAVQPGQFVMVRCGKENLLRRPLSIHRLDKKTGKLALLVSVVGKGTNWLSKCQAGDKIDIVGPLGSGLFTFPGAHNLLLLAGGIGIAPLCFLAEVALDRGCSVILLWGASTAAKLCPSHLLPTGIKYITATEDGTGGKKGVLTDLLPDFIGWADQICACGPSSMYRAIAKQNRRLLRPKPIQVSLEVRMGCGLGVCYGCTVKTKTGLKQICKDGPVFGLDNIIWDELVDI